LPLKNKEAAFPGKKVATSMILITARFSRGLCCRHYATTARRAQEALKGRLPPASKKFVFSRRPSP
jgi:hypothetical protein